MKHNKKHNKSKPSPISLTHRVRNWLWWKAYRWVFGVKYDSRWMHINDKFNAKWREGWQAGVRYMKDKNMRSSIHDN